MTLDFLGTAKKDVNSARIDLEEKGLTFFSLLTFDNGITQGGKSVGSELQRPSSFLESWFHLNLYLTSLSQDKSARSFFLETLPSLLSLPMLYVLLVAL